MADDPVINNDPDEELRRQREEEMERLLLAQENDDDANDDDDEPLQDDEQEQQQAEPPEFPLGISRPRIPYIQTSFGAAVAVVYYALRTRQQWYLALVYLTTSKFAYIVMGNALIAFAISVFEFIVNSFLQGLRLAEAEGLGDFFRWNVTETCLALTMFRSELQVDTFLIFLLLILAKCLHWVADMREGHLRMTQEAIVPITQPGWRQGWPTIPVPHVRLWLLLVCLIGVDILAVIQCGYTIAKYGPSVAILFGFETAILLVTAVSNLLLWYLHVFDGLLHYLHDHTPSTQRVHAWLHAWKDHKATLTFAVEVQAQGAKFLFYVSFFAIVLTYYGLPINLFREVYMSFQSLKSRLLAFAKYRRLMASMDRFDSVATDQELEEAGRVCIICRDEMTLAGSKRLPGCAHVFHKSCLREWLVQQQSCPTCRGDIAAMEARQRQQQRAEERRVAEEEAQQQQAPQETEQTQQQQQQEQPTQQQQQQQESEPPALTREVPATTTAASNKSVRIDDAVFKTVWRPLLPGLFRVSAEQGAQVWSDEGLVIRTVPQGVAILCTELQWKTFGDRGGRMYRMPDGWVRQENIERINGVRLPVE